MAYNLKDVFYLDTSVLIAKSTSGAGSGQLDLSAYIDPIARGRTKGTGLAIYKVHWSMVDQDNAAEPVDVAEDGTVQFGLIAGLGSGDVATGGGNITSSAQFDNTNNLLISQGSFYGPKSMSANANTTISMFPNSMVMPSTEVPYVIVRGVSLSMCVSPSQVCLSQCLCLSHNVRVSLSGCMSFSVCVCF